MFKTGDSVRYIGRKADWYGEVWTVKHSTIGRQYRGGGYCSFYEVPGLIIAWGNLEEALAIDLENK